MNRLVLNKITANEINISVQKDKYKLLDKIDKDKLELVLDDIFELGYSQYMKKFIKQDLFDDLDLNINFNQIKPYQVNQANQANQVNQINSITESKLSTHKGFMGEDLIMDILLNKFNNFCVENTSKIPHSGDIQVRLPSGNVIILEVKNYNKTIDQDQIDKLKYDMIFGGVRGAIFISLNSGIVGKKKFDLEIFKHNHMEHYILFLPYSMHKIIPDKKNLIAHNDMDDSIYNLTLKLEFGLCIVQNIIDKHNNYIVSGIKNISHTDLDFMITQFNSIYDEFKIVKNSTRKLDENIHKSIESHKNTIKEFESTIKLKITNLIGSKLCSEENCISGDKKMIRIKKNNFKSYDILINDVLSGMICKISNSYDVLININNNLINKQFEDLEQSKIFIKSL